MMIFDEGNSWFQFQRACFEDWKLERSNFLCIFHLVCNFGGAFMKREREREGTVKL